MFQFSGFPSVQLCIYCTVREYCSRGLPHSEICGSMAICASPQLIAAYHVLLRLPVTRHSPCALLSLTFCLFCVFLTNTAKNTYIVFSFQRCGALLRSILLFFAIALLFARRTQVRLSLQKNDSLLKNLAEDEIHDTLYRYLGPYNYSLDLFT